tara:strand:- start:586 stop:825 length:240 start_codon:yes stop_codon:yes gene_type:complete
MGWERSIANSPVNRRLLIASKPSNTTLSVQMKTTEVLERNRTSAGELTVKPAGTIRESANPQQAAHNRKITKGARINIL